MGKLRRIFSLGLGLCAFAGTLAAQNQIIVTTTVDENDGPSAGTGLSLREAIDLANQTPLTEDIIILTSGETYTLSILENFVGQLNVMTDMTIQSSVVTEPATIDGQSSSRIMAVTAPENISVNIFDINFRNGRPASGESKAGGALFVGPAASLIISDCGFYNNNADNPSIVTGDAFGGAIYYQAPFGPLGPSFLDIVRCEFVGNTTGANSSVAENGNAIYVQNGGNIFVSSSRFGSGNGPNPTVGVEIPTGNEDFNGNWWGRNSGPNESPALISGVTPDNWLVLTFEATETMPGPPPVNIEFFADLNLLNDGGGTLDFVRNGIPINWNTGRAGAYTVEDTLTNGEATTLLMTQTAIGTSTEQVQLDDETLEIVLTLGPPIGTLTDPDVVTMLDENTRDASLFNGLGFSATGAADQFQSATIEVLNPQDGMAESFVIDPSTGIDMGNVTVGTNSITITEDADSATYINYLTNTRYVNMTGVPTGGDRQIRLTWNNDPVTGFEVDQTVEYPESFPVPPGDFWVIFGVGN